MKANKCVKHSNHLLAHFIWPYEAENQDKRCVFFLVFFSVAVVVVYHSFMCAIAALYFHCNACSLATMQFISLLIIAFAKVHFAVTIRLGCIGFSCSKSLPVRLFGSLHLFVICSRSRESGYSRYKTKAHNAKFTANNNNNNSGKIAVIDIYIYIYTHARNRRRLWSNQYRHKHTMFVWQMWYVQYVWKSYKVAGMLCVCVCVCGADKIYVLLFVLLECSVLHLKLHFSVLLLLGFFFSRSADIVARCLSLIISHLPQSNIETERSFHSTTLQFNARCIVMHLHSASPPLALFMWTLWSGCARDACT